MILLRNAFMTATLLFLSACSTLTIEVPPVGEASSQIRQTPIPGNYATMIQTGAWQLKVNCSGDAWAISAVAIVDKAYREAMQAKLSKALAKVAFINTMLSPEDLKKEGYDAQILIYQGNGSASFNLKAGSLFSPATGLGRVDLNSNIALIGSDGVIAQYPLSGSGTDQNTSHSIVDMIGLSGQEAVNNLVERSTMYIRDGLRDYKEKTHRDKDKKPNS